MQFSYATDCLDTLKQYANAVCKRCGGSMRCRKRLWEENKVKSPQIILLYQNNLLTLLP